MDASVVEISVAFRKRFGTDVPPQLRGLCESRPDVRRSLALKMGLPVSAVASVLSGPHPPAGLPCVYRSKEPIGREPCLPCSAGKTVLIDVYRCDSPYVKGGRCTIAKGKEAANARPCEFCGKRVEPPVDAVYFFRHSGAADEELRYSIRSLLQHAPWVRRVHILGDRPLWYADSDSRVVHVPWEAVASQMGFAAPVRNVFQMLVATTAIPDIADEFLVLADDFALVRDLSPEAARVVRCRNDSPPRKPKKPHLYQEALYRTQTTLKKLGYPAIDFDAHVPTLFTKRRILDAYRDLKDHTASGRHAGMLGKVAVLNHAMKQEGFAPLRPKDERFRVVYTEKNRPTTEGVREACALPTVLFLNFDDDTWGPGIRDFLQERFPAPAACELPAAGFHSEASASAASGLHTHVVKASGWIIGRVANAIRCGRTTVSDRPDPRADVNFYVHHRAMRQYVPGTLNVAWMTHLAEPWKPRYRREFFDVAKKADLCLAMCERTALHCPPEKTRFWAGAPDREFVKPMLRLGVAVKPGPRKGLEKLNAIRGLPGVEVVETGGTMPLAELPAFFRSIDFLVVTSDLEGGPYSVLEAIAAGKPVIAPDVGFCWDYPVIKYDGTAKGLEAVVRKLRFPVDPWAAANQELEAILREALAEKAAGVLSAA